MSEESAPLRIGVLAIQGDYAAHAEALAEAGALPIEVRKPEELLGLDTETLLSRIFPEETVRLYPAKPVSYSCPEDWDKVREMVRSLGQAEVEAILQEHGEVTIKDDICNREYRFDAEAIAELFAPENRPTLH